MNSTKPRLVKVLCGLCGTVLVTFMLLRHQTYDPGPSITDRSSRLAASSCPIIRLEPKYLHGRWQTHTTNQTLHISAFSAFLDQRKNSKSDFVVRIFVISSAKKDKPIHCQLWYSNKVLPVVVTAEIKDIGRGANFHGVKYQEYLYTCPVTEVNIIPHHVSLAFAKCDSSTIYLPVIHNKFSNVDANSSVADGDNRTRELPSEWEHEFGICVAVTYGDVDPLRIIEWVEFNKLLGVTEINIYNSSVSKRALDIFHHYSKEGMINLHSAPPPIPSWEYWPKKLAVIPGLNDCLYRNMYRYRYVIVVDLDEIIIPRLHSNYKSMFSEIDKLHSSKISFPSYQFRNSYFFLDLPEDPSIPSYLTTIRQQTRVAPSDPGYSVKTISDPRTCVVLSNHYCLVRLPVPSRQWTLSVNTDFAMNQHYKKCHFSKDQCNKIMQKHYHDNTTEKFKSKLDEAVKKRLYLLDLL